jgi:hypothetical protein
LAQAKGANIRKITDVNNIGQTFVMNQLRCGSAMTLHLFRDFVQCPCLMLSLDRQSAGLEASSQPTRVICALTS